MTRTDREAFTEFVRMVEPRLRIALIARYGPERGREAAAEAPPSPGSTGNGSGYHTVGGQFTQDFLERPQTNDRLRGDLAEADVILFLIPNGEWKEPCYTIMGEDGRDPADCGGSDGLECLRGVAASYQAMAELVFAELTTLADPSEALIRGMDFAGASGVHGGDIPPCTAPEWLGRYAADAPSRSMARRCGVSATTTCRSIEFASRDKPRRPIIRTTITAPSVRPARMAASTISSEPLATP